MEKDTVIKIIGKKAFSKPEALSRKNLDKLANYYMDNGIMPYGIMKARTGDPDEWIRYRIMDIIHKEATCL
jgi:hypothetical protein